MSDNSFIDYVNASIQPIGWGCLGPGGSPEKPNRCPYCYAYRMAKRNLRDCPQCRAFVPHWHPGELLQVERWVRPRRIFVESMGDLFGRTITSQQREDIWKCMGWNGQHTYLMLTKEAERMSRALCREWNGPPLPNLWIGVSITTQADADERIPWLTKTPAAVRWLSVEPMQASVDLSRWLAIRPVTYPACWERVSGGYNLIDWVVIGQETGNRKGKVIPKREWVEAIVEQCKAAGVPCFLKGNLSAIWGGEMIQELPEARP